MKALVFSLLVVWTSCCVSQTPHNGDKYFSDIVKPRGWPIPPHGREVRSESRSFGKDHEDVRVIFYKPLHHFGLPSYYKDAQGELVLRSFYWNAKKIYALEQHGVRFGYGAYVEGEGVGIAGPVFWLDMDGDGRFRRISWGPEDQLEVPGWVKRVKN